MQQQSSCKTTLHIHAHASIKLALRRQSAAGIQGVSFVRHLPLTSYITRPQDTAVVSPSVQKEKAPVFPWRLPLETVLSPRR